MNDSINYECLKYFEREFLEAIETHDLHKIKMIYTTCIGLDIECAQFIKTLDALLDYAQTDFGFDDKEIFTAIGEGYMNKSDLLCSLKNLIR